MDCSPLAIKAGFTERLALSNCEKCTSCPCTFVIVFKAISKKMLASLVALKFKIKFFLDPECCSVCYEGIPQITKL